MFEKFSRSWQLVKASASVLAQDKQLLVFPLASSVAALVVSLAFIFPALGLGAIDGLRSGGSFSIGMIVLGFLFYLSQYFVIFYFNAALIGAVMIRLDGGTPTVSDGFRIANSKIGAILGYALIAATVGMILRAIQERAGFIGNIIVGLIGVAWTLATSMVVPVLVTRDVGPIEAVKESASLLKKTWGENIIGNAGIGIVFTVLAFALIIVSAVLIFGALATKSIAAVVFVGALAVAAFILMSLVQAALTGIYSAALYRYAESGEGSLGFDKNLLGGAFGAKA
jgi:hypothetical protein